jgi:hypothetical protein
MGLFGLSLPKKKSVSDLLSRAYDQVNPLDQGKSWQNRTPRTTGNVGQQIQRNITNTGERLLTNVSNKVASNKVVAPVTYGVGRSAAGTGEGLGGLFDLATPGKGNNRFGQGAKNIGATADSIVKAGNYNKYLYKGGQAGGDVATFLIGGGPLTKGVTKAGQVGSKLPYASKALNYADDLAKNGTRIQKAAAGGVRYLARPDVASDIIADTGLNAGLRANRGKDVSPQSMAVDAGTSIAFGGALGLAGKGAKEAAKPVVRGLRDKSIIRPSRLNDAEVADLSNFRQASGGMMDDNTYKAGKAAANKAGVDYRDTTKVDELLGAHKTYDTRKTQKQAGSVGGDNSNQPTIKNVLTGEDIPNPQYKPKAEPKQPVVPQPTKSVQNPVVSSPNNTTGMEKALEQIMVEDGIGREAATIKLDKIIRRDTALGQNVGSSDKPLEAITGKVKKDPRVKKLLEGFSVAMNKPRTEAALTASRVASKARELGVKLDRGFIDRYQSGTLATNEERVMGDFIRTNITDPLFKAQSVLDPTIQYRKNYIPQSYRQEADAVEAATRKLQQQTGAASPRAFSTYAEAEQFGLSPEYNQLDQMLGANTESASRALANRKLIKDGLKDGIFSNNPSSGTPVTGFFSPNGQQIYAQKAVADIFNGITQKESGGLGRVLRGTAKASQVAQDVALQGGVPGTNLNFFVFGQGVKDTTRNIGKFAFHPIQAVKQEGNLIGDFFRGNAGTQARFAKNSAFVREMANRGLNITPQSSLSGKGKNVVERGWDTLGNNPTFGRYMPNRLLSTAQEVYQQSVGKIGHEAALDLAAAQTKAFTGVVDQVTKGRTNLTADGIATVFFAPKYRESIINALANVVKSVTTKAGDKSYKASRELALGMMITLAGYEALNRQINGHSMFDNREGQELSVQIPYGQKDEKGNQPVINLPFMPGFMTIPRAIAGAASSTKNGNVKGVVAEGSKLLSMPLTTAGAVVGNRDYFGRPLYIDQATADREGVTPDTGTAAAKKAGLYIAGQLSPAWARAGMNAAQGKPVEQNVATALEAPVRFGKVLNPETKAYFDSRDKFYSGLDKNERTLFDKINPKKKDIVGGDISLDKNTLATPAKYGDLLANTSFTSKYKAYKQSEKNHDPLWDLNDNQLRSYMQAQVISKNNPGGDSKTVSALYKRLPASFFTKREQYFSDLKDKGVDLGGSDYTPRPKMPDNLVSFSESYHKLPYGTGARSAALRSPDGKAYIAYLDQNKLYNNQERADLGLPPLEDENSQYSSSGGGSRRGSSGSSRDTGGFSTSKYVNSISTPSSGKKQTSSIRAKKVSVRARSAKTSLPTVSLKKSLV